MSILPSHNYSDSYSERIFDPLQTIVIEDVLKAFISSTPTFVVFLLFCRDKVMSLFGLKTNPGTYSKQELLNSIQLEEGSSIGLFNIYKLEQNEALLGEDDTHLDFRLCIRITREGDYAIIEMQTTVRLHNRLGKLYFFFVKFPHKLLVPFLLKRIIRLL